MPNYDENQLLLALQRTAVMREATHELPQNASEMVMIHAEDAHVLREFAAQQLQKADVEMSLAINALNKRYAEYGTGALMVRLPRSAFDLQLFLKPHVTVTVTQENR